MSKIFPFKIITPGGKIFDGEIESLSAPSTEGSIGILANHAPLITSLEKGIVHIKEVNAEKFFIINSGILEINDNNDVLLLADNASEANNAEDATERIKKLSPNILET